MSNNYSKSYHQTTHTVTAIVSCNSLHIHLLMQSHACESYLIMKISCRNVVVFRSDNAVVHIMTSVSSLKIL